MSKQKDKTCVPVVPQATEEQRETLHMKAIGKQQNKKRVLDLIQGSSNFFIAETVEKEGTKTKIQYEVYLRHGDEEGEFTVDVREDIVTLDDDPVTEEYIEGFGFDTYDEAKKIYLDMMAKYDTLDTELCTWNEIEDE
jgi:hypothetical protein